MKWHDQIENLTNASDYLDYARKLIVTQKIEHTIKQELTNKLKSIQLRLQDQNLYVAVVGRASTGKSTFINALLKDILLQSGVLQMTTSTATFIKYGTRLSIEVRFKNITSLKELGINLANKEIYLQESETSSSKLDTDQTYLLRLSKANEPIIVNDESFSLREFIHLLSTSDDFAQHISSLSIITPASFLQSGIVIIDTPGANATNENHRKITRSAVEQADTAIIITPGDQSVSSWLLDILKDPNFLQPLLHRCVYMMTQMDFVTKSARRQNFKTAIQLVRKDAEKRLQQGLQSANLPKKPRVFMSAAQVVLDEFNKEDRTVIDEEEHQYWCNEFTIFQEEFIRYLVYQRAEAIADSVLRLLDDLFESMETQLSLLWTNYHERVSQQEALIEDIDEFCTDQRIEWKKQFLRTKRHGKDKIILMIGKERDKQMRIIREGVLNTTTLDELKGFVKDKVEKKLKESATRIQSALKKTTLSVTEQAIQFNQSFERDFSTLYQQLKLIARTRNISENQKLAFLASHSNVSVENDNISEALSNGGQLTAAVIGGLIGAFLGPLGAIIGGAIGSFFGPSLEDRKEKIWNDLQPQIINYYSQSQKEATKTATIFCDNMNQKIKRHIKKYADKYGLEVEQMRQFQMQERQELETLQAQLKKDLTELKTRRLQVKEQREDLLLNLKTLIH